MINHRTPKALGIFLALVFCPAYAKDFNFDNSAYILIDHDTGAVLAQKNAQSPLPPASLTKMMTSYLTEQYLLSGQLNENTPIKVSERAWCRGSSTESCLYVPVGGTASALDMLKGVIISSGNDAAMALAEHIGGSEENFVNLMNAQAKKLGMTNTHFANATGMPADDHKASAQDLARLGQAIIHHSARYYPLYSQTDFSFNNIKQGNRNTLLGKMGVDGLKTGHTSQAGFCLAATAKKDDMRLIAVILGAKSAQARAAQATELLQYGFEHFTKIAVVASGKSLGTAPVRFGNEVDIIAGESLGVFNAKGTPRAISTQIALLPLTAPIAKGAVIGQIHAIEAGRVVASAPLLAGNDVAERGFFGKLWERILELFK